MTNYLISFPSRAMVIPAGEFDTVVRESHEVIRAMKEAGVYRFGGGVNEDVPAVLVSGDGTVSDDTYPEMKDFNGGFCVVTCDTREEALEWAARTAAACRCAQELREWMYDPES